MTDTPTLPLSPGRLGRLPKRAEGDRLPLKWATEYLKTPLPTPTYPIDVSGGITAWGMLGNDTYGDCGVAGRYHVDMATAVGAGQPVPSFTDTQVVQEYLTYDKGQDNGVVLADYLLWCYQQGKILAFAPVDHSKASECDAFVQAGHALYIGVNLGDADEGTFGTGNPWTNTNNPPDPSLGHCVVTVKVAAVDGLRGLVTWGAEQGADAGWYAPGESGGHLDEAWLVVTTEEQAAAFTAALFADVQALGGTGGQPPVPAPPPPVPEPPPVPPAPPPTPPVPEPPPAPPPTPPTPTPPTPPSPEPPEPPDIIEDIIEDFEELIDEIEGAEASLAKVFPANSQPATDLSSPKWRGMDYP